MIDLHSHILPGIDDGCSDLDESLRMAEYYLESGVEEVSCTPHIGSLRYASAERKMDAAFLSLQEALEKRSLPLRLHSGGEVRSSRLAKLSHADLDNYSLGQSSWVLLEIGEPFTPSVGASLAKKAIGSLQEQGYSVLLAHPERSLRSIEDIRKLHSEGVGMQVTACSLVGDYGKKAEELGRSTLDEGLATVVASDGHTPSHRPPSLAEPMEQAGYGHLLDELCSKMPRRILYG